MQIIDLAHKEEAVKSGREVIALDSSAIATWLECHKKHKLAYIENLQPVGQEKTFFGRGKLVHKLLEFYYQMLMEGYDRTAAIQFAIKSAMDYIDENDEGTVIAQEDWTLISQRFIAYTNHWASEKIQIKGLEVGFSVPILDTDKSLYVLEGRIDFLAENEDWGLYWMDHKSQAREYKYYGYTPQFLNYALALNCRHGVLNYFGLQKSAPAGKSLFSRDVFLYSKEVLNEWRFELITIFSEIYRARQSGFFRKNRLSCKHGLNYKCQFTHLCEQTNPAFEASLKRTEFTEREPWSPWSTEEVSHD